jgi:hypothetical protein
MKDKDIQDLSIRLKFHQINRLLYQLDLRALYFFGKHQMMFYWIKFNNSYQHLLNKSHKKLLNQINNKVLKEV